jgi:hypothetical protein
LEGIFEENEDRFDLMAVESRHLSEGTEENKKVRRPKRTFASLKLLNGV